MFATAPLLGKQDSKRCRDASSLLKKQKKQKRREREGYEGGDGWRGRH